MVNRPIDVISAGHICLDVIPRLSSRFRTAEDIFMPGVLSQVGPATLALGGSVANTGLTLHRLGAKTRMLGKVGGDLLGTAILEALRDVDPSIAESMVISPSESTSYTIVLSPPNVDRGFLHCPGTNDSFTAADLANVNWSDARILHFGYPPLMRGTIVDNGVGVAATFSQAQKAGAIVSLDMATPNDDGTNWRKWLHNVLPYVDVFLPSIDEICLMLEPLRDEDSIPADMIRQQPANATLLAEVADELHEFGAPIVVIKLGDQGLYLSSRAPLTSLSARDAWGDHDWSAWEGRQMLAPCFEVDVVGTTGSGDCTIAGFLWALLNGHLPEQALRFGAAVGAHCVESADATSNIPPSPRIESRLEASWPPLPVSIELAGWQFSHERGVYIGPQDTTFPGWAASGSATPQ